MPKKFLRRSTDRYSKLGKGRKKKQKWKKPTGRDNKMREKRRGYPKVVSIGYRTEKKNRGKIRNKEPMVVRNIMELEKIKENQIAIIGKVGKKKRLEIVKKAQEKEIEIQNINIKKYLKTNERKSVKKEEIKPKETKKWN